MDFTDSNKRPLDLESNSESNVTNHYNNDYLCYMKRMRYNYFRILYYKDLSHFMKQYNNNLNYNGITYTDVYSPPVHSVIREVFSLLSIPKLLFCRRICKKWKNFIDQEIPNRLNTISMHTIFPAHWEEERKQIQLSDLKVLLKKYGRNVQNIYTIGIIKFPNILDIEFLEILFALPRLKKLQICHEHFHIRIYNKSVNIMNYVCEFLPEQLVEFIFSDYYYPDEIGKTSYLYSKFNELKDYRPRLEHFLLTKSRTWQHLVLRFGKYYVDYKSQNIPRFELSQNVIYENIVFLSIVIHDYSKLNVNDNELDIMNQCFPNLKRVNFLLQTLNLQWSQFNHILSKIEILKIVINTKDDYRRIKDVKTKAPYLKNLLIQTNETVGTRKIINDLLTHSTELEILQLGIDEGDFFMRGIRFNKLWSLRSLQKLWLTVHLEQNVLKKICLANPRIINLKYLYFDDPKDNVNNYLNQKYREMPLPTEPNDERILTLIERGDSTKIENANPDHPYLNKLQFNGLIQIMETWKYLRPVNPDDFEHLSFGYCDNHMMQ